MPYQQQEPNGRPTLSVIVPNYNHGAWIARALNAILSQSLVPDEIIVIDDGSTDDSMLVIAEFASKSQAVKVIRNAQNEGLVATLQRGLELATSRYIYFGAADDWVQDGFFELAVEVLERYPEQGLFAGEALLVDGLTGSPTGHRPIVRPRRGAGPIKATEARELLARSDNWILTGSTVFRRIAVVEAGGFDRALGSFADSYVAKKIALTHGFYYAPRVVATWCIFSSGASRTTALDLDKAQHVLEIIPPLLTADPAFPPWYSVLFSRRWRFSAGRLSIKTNPINRALVLAMVGPAPLDRRVVQGLFATGDGWWCRFALQLWLWLRLRPYRLTDVIGTALSRKFEALVRR